MVFWIGILVGAVSAWYAIKKGFYETWAMLFNMVISIYLAVFLGPVLADIAPEAADMPHSSVVTIVITGVGAFLILHGISYLFFTSQFRVKVPRVFDVFGGGILGFLTGFLGWSFLSFVICITPISQNKFVKKIGFNNQDQQTNIVYISWWCDAVNKIVASKNNKCTTKQAINRLLEFVENTPETEDHQAEPSESGEPNDAEGGYSESDTLSRSDRCDAEDIHMNINHGSDIQSLRPLGT